MAKIIRYYISLAFAKLDPLGLAAFGENLVTRMTGLAPLTPSDPPLTAITAACTDLRTKQEAMKQGGNAVKIARDDAFDVLEGLIRDLAFFVQDNAKNDRNLITATGFDVVDPNPAAPTIIIPSILEISNYAVCKLQFEIQNCGARAYEIWGRTGTADFAHFLSVTNLRLDIIVGDLTSGALYDWKVRALYTNNVYSDWSDITSHRAT